MNYSDDTFVTNLLASLAVLATIGLTIWMRASGRLRLSVLLLILSIIGAILIPCGLSILFVICKLTHVLDLGWGWIVLALTIDGLKMPMYNL